MTRVLVLSVMLCLIAAAGAFAVAAEIDWAPNLDKAQQLAIEKDKLVMVDFYTDWCGWCKELDKTVYTNRDVQQIADEHFVSVKVDAEKSPEVRSKFNVRGYPTVVFLTADGRELLRVPGYEPPQLFAADMRKAVELKGMANHAAELEERLESQEGTPEIYAELGYLWRQLGDVVKAREYLSKARSAGLQSPGLDLDWVLISRRGPALVSALEQWLRANPSSERLAEASYELGMAQAGLQKWGQAVAAMDRAAQTSPQSWWGVRSEYLSKIIRDRYLKTQDDCRT